MRLTYDQICIFVGYLSRKGFEYVSIFLESLLTGASIKRILTKPEDLPKHLPAGLYRDISKQDLFGHIPSYDDFKKMMNDFNKQHKMFSFSLSRIPYTGKARLLDVKNLNLTPLETQHTSSSILPGMGSSLYYVQPDDNIVNRLDNANISFLNELIAFSKNGFIGPLKTYNELINRSTHFFQDRINTISLDRESIWADKKPTIFILPDNELLPIYKRLENNFLTANDPSSKLQAMECIAMYLTMLTLLLRPCETKRLLRDDYYDIFGILFVSGKGNKSYFESRILPVAASMQTFLDLYLKYIELDKVACLIMDNVQDKYLFPFPKETMDKLETILQDFDLNYTPYICRRTSATKLHNKLRPLFNIFQAIMGHSQSGFESAGLFSRIQFSSIRSVVETYSTDPVILEILPKAIKLLENSL
jgi:integrase